MRHDHISYIIYADILLKYMLMSGKYGGLSVSKILNVFWVY